jgi:hypothetical protein
MKLSIFAKFILTPLLFVFIIMSACNKDKLNNASFIKFEVAGPLMNGVFTIEDKGQVFFPLATGLLYPKTDTEEETAILTYQNEDQDLSVVLVFPPKKGLIELLLDETHYIGVSDLKNNVFLASKTVSLNVSSFKKRGSPLSNALGGTFDAKGTFNGIMVYVDSSTGEEFSHVFTGEFEYNN